MGMMILSHFRYIFNLVNKSQDERQINLAIESVYASLKKNIN